MKLLGAGPQEVHLEELVQNQVQGDYIYMYPPRQSYYPMDSNRLQACIRDSLSCTCNEPANLYIHFPFCRQICAFCNLYSVAARPDEQFSDYVDLLRREVELWAPFIAGRTVDTIYLGGGTPSILPIDQLDRCLYSLENALGISRSRVPEVAIEVAPDTVDEVKLKAMRDIGITRVNLGLQTTSDEGLHRIGRRHGFVLARKSIENAIASGFKNVCVDLIYGLPEQSESDWRNIVLDVLELRPPTICAYPLTLRPNTGFARKGMTLIGSQQYSKYEIALQLLGEAGYAQETHVRYIMPGVGGYRQKENHWAGQDIIGIGAGARGYLRYCDYRNGYSIQRRRNALEAYAFRMRSGQLPYNAGFCLTEEERMRRQIILGLFDFDRSRFRDEFCSDVGEVFGCELASLKKLDLIDMSSDRLLLTKKGRKYRDLIVQLFFSEDVWQRVAKFDYME